jgi:hypothetical protein
VRAIRETDSAAGSPLPNPNQLPFVAPCRHIGILTPFEWVRAWVEGLVCRITAEPVLRAAVHLSRCPARAADVASRTPGPVCRARERLRVRGDVGSTWRDLIPYLSIGTPVGAFFCAIVFAATAFSLPMLLDRHADAITAVMTSITRYRDNGAGGPRVLRYTVPAEQAAPGSAGRVEPTCTRLTTVNLCAAGIADLRR